jgi:hypothetical protein
MGPKSSKRRVTGLSCQNGGLYVSRQNVDLRIDRHKNPGPESVDLFEVYCSCLFSKLTMTLVND